MAKETHEEVWNSAVTLGETILKMVEGKLTKTPEFIWLLNFYGRERVARLYLEEKKEKKGTKYEV